MLIQKKFQGDIPENKILDTHSTSNTDAYSCNYVNEFIEDELNSKADNVTFTNNILQLKSGDTLIGDPVEINVKGTEVFISEEEPETDDWKVWIDTGEVQNLGSEVVNSMSDNETTKAPSVRAIKEYIEGKFKFTQTQIPTSSLTVTGATGVTADRLYIEVNNDGTMFKLYGLITGSDQTGTGKITYQSSLRPAYNKTFTGVFKLQAQTGYDYTNNRIMQSYFIVKTNGEIEFEFLGAYTYPFLKLMLTECIYVL